MSYKDEQSMVSLEIIPNPSNHDLPYRVKLTDEGNGRTVSADFSLELNRLKELFIQDDPEKYGNHLFEQVFRYSYNKENKKKGEVGLRFRDIIRRVEDSAEDKLRIRLKIATTLPKLYALAWEYLFDSEFDELGLSLGADRMLTLFRDIDVDAAGYDPIRDLPSVLIAVVSPSESSLCQLNRTYDKDLKPIQLERENERLEKLFDTIQKEKERPSLVYQILPVKAPPGLSKLDQIVEAMDDGKFHLLHINCHGIILKNKSYLVFADSDNRFKLISAKNLLNKLNNMNHIRLILLDACQSATQSELGALSGMIPQLIKCVSPAVIGMQRIWFTGIADDRFTKSFYSELCKHGSVDQAIQQARCGLRQWGPNRWEWGTPVLYLRQENGQLFTFKKQTRKVHKRGGTGLYFGPKARVKNVKIDAKAAGGSIYEGYEKIPETAAKPPGIGIHMEGEIEDVEIKGEYAGGSIFHKALKKQAKKIFNQTDRNHAIQELIMYYNKRLKEIESLINNKQVDKKRIQIEQNDICKEINELKTKL